MNVNDWSDKDKRQVGTFLQWNSYRSEHHKLYYVSTPKVACTSLKWWFADIEGYTEALEASRESFESDPDLVVHDLSHKFAPHVTGIPLASLEEALTSPDYLRFAVVRNPFKRVFSAWQSKLLMREPLQIGPYRDKAFFDCPIETTGNVADAFEQFMEYLATEEAPEFRDHHWMPQTMVLRPDLIDYALISQIENPHALSRTLGDWLKGAASDPLSARRSNESFIPYTPDLLTPRSVDLIRDLYARDFEQFGYDTAVPPSRETLHEGEWDIALKAIKFGRARHQMLGQRNDQVVALTKLVVESNRDAKDPFANLARLQGAEARRKNISAQFEELSRRHTNALVTIEDSRARLQVADARVEALSRRVGSLEREREELLDQIAAYTNSRSWRLTGGLRAFSAAASDLRHRASANGATLLRRSRWIAGGSLSSAAIRKIRKSDLFDADFYRSAYPDVAETGVDPARHYALVGWKELRNPSARFDTSRYLADHPELASRSTNPLLHYLRSVRRNSGAAAAIQSHASSLDRDLGSAATAQDEPQAATDARLESEIETIDRSGRFDETFYLAMYPELRLPAGEALRHYCTHGWKEGRDPSNDFETELYLETHDDIRRAGINPFWHYVVAGALEQRLAYHSPTTLWEDDAWFGDIRSDVKLLAFYAAPDWDAVRQGRCLFEGHIQPKRPDDRFVEMCPVDANILRSQAELAKSHGVAGLCFDLTAGAPRQAANDSPLDCLLAQSDIDIGFCVRIRLSTVVSIETIGAALTPVFGDPRYLHVAGAPLLLVDMNTVTSGRIPELRQWLHDHAVMSVFVLGSRTVGPSDGLDDANPEECDALLDFVAPPAASEIRDFPFIEENGIRTVPYRIVSALARRRLRNAQTLACSIYPVVSLAHDDTVSNPSRPMVYTAFSIRIYRQWLDDAVRQVRATHQADRRFVFINALNDWNKGCYLEPDRTGGFDKLNETTRALTGLTARMPTPKISVLVPAHNQDEFLRQRLESVYNQTYKNIEVLLLDDSSSDRSPDLFEEYRAAHPRITRTFQEEHYSGSHLRQWSKGIKAATGELVWIAEGDDFTDERFLERLVRCFDDEAVLLAYGPSIYVDRDEVITAGAFGNYLASIGDPSKWERAYVNTAHLEVQEVLGLRNTIPHPGGVLFKRPIGLPLLDDETWLSMRVAGDWIFYLHVLRGGKIAYAPEAVNFARRYPGSASEVYSGTEKLYREAGSASRAVASLYNVPVSLLERCRDLHEHIYEAKVGGPVGDFYAWFDHEAVLQARKSRVPNVLMTTTCFTAGGAEILPIRLANEMKRQGLSVLLLSTGVREREFGIRRMVRNDVPVVETWQVPEIRALIHAFGIEALNSHQWHVQKFPLQIEDVYDELSTHVASLHGMIEYTGGDPATAEEIAAADRNVTTWAYTADKNLKPFIENGFDVQNPRFAKFANGLEVTDIVPVSRAQLKIPDDAFVLCCVSRAIPEKGWAEAITCVAQARDVTGLDIRLLLVGNGPVYDEYSRSGTPEFVHMVGFSEDSVGHYAAADMGIMLSKFRSESFPLTIVDCLFAGKPYISSDIGEIRTMLTVDTGVAGALVDLKDWEVSIDQAVDAIVTFASGKEKYRAACDRVVVAAHRYRIDVVASRYIEFFMAGKGQPSIGKRKALQ